MRRSRLRKIGSFVLKQAGLQRTGGTRDPAFQHGTAYGIDRVIVVSGFGAFVTGWLLSPRRRVLNMVLLGGGQTLTGDRSCLVTMSRPDLVAFTDYADAVRTAGFKAVFRGHAIESRMVAPLLRVHLDDGRATVLKVPEKVVRRCDGSEMLTTVANLFPSLANEHYLEDFVNAFGATARQRAAEIVPIVTAKLRRVALMVLPSKWDDLFLVMAEISRNVARLPADVGLVFLADAHYPRASILDRFKDLRNATERSLSLFEISDPTYALWSVAPLLAECEAETFWFCGPEVMPKLAGWHAIASYFEDDRSGLELFVRADADGGMREPESLSFAWRADAFAAWAASAPFFLGGFHRDNHLPAAPQPARHDGAIGLLRTMVGHEPIRRADERLYGAAPDQIEASP